MRISVRELEAHRSRYLAERGPRKTLEISRHRKVIAGVTGVPAAPDADLARLLESGAASWQGTPLGGRVDVSPAAPPVSAMILGNRG